MPNPNTTTIDPIRKAAILISTLDHRVADQLLERMSDEHASLVRNTAMDLDEIPEHEQALVMQEFLGTDTPDDEADVGGVELDEELARKLATHETVTEPPISISESDDVPFRFLHDTEAELLVSHLEHENPQIIAVVMAHLPPRQAAALLKRFESPLQASLLRRIAELDTADPDIVREVEKHLKMLLQDDLRAAQNRAIGLSTVSSILTAAGETRGQLVSSLTRHDRQLALQLRDPAHAVVAPRTSSDVKPDGEPIEPQHRAKHFEADEPHEPTPASPARASTKHHTSDTVTVTFDELATLSDRDLALVFSESDSKLALLALAGASPAFVEHLLKQLPPRAAKSLRQRMEQLGPLRLSDIEQAQSEIAEIAGRLIVAGTINAPKPEPFAVAA